MPKEHKTENSQKKDDSNTGWNANRQLEHLEKLV
tara:strand:+ start:3000 stop:3101 length:102 start_codon:yes stop_codon:yes gene_type:complete